MAVPATATDRTILAPDATIETPALIVSEEILHRNIAEMASFARSHDVNLRPHMKTHKTPQIARLQLQAGAIGITCAKVGEAEVMIDQAGVEDVLLAYPTVGESKFRRILALLDRARVVVGVDSIEATEALGRLATQQDRTVDVFIEVDTGHHRSGVPAGEPAVAFAQQVARQRGLRLCGVFTHEGQANSAPADEIEGIALAAGRAMVETAEAIRNRGIELETVSVGSTPAALYTPTVPGITEMRPGTYVFNDNSAFRFGRLGVGDCAARFAATVVSRTSASHCIVDTGSKSLAMDPSKAHPGHGYIVGHPDATIVKLSEEHGEVQIPDGEAGFAIGDRLEIIPNHICPTVNLMDEMFLVRDGHVVDSWKIAARGKVR